MDSARGRDKQRGKQNPGQEGTQAPDVSVVVLKAKVLKAKQGSSRAARRAEDIERRVSKSLRRVTKAVDKGMSAYIDARDKSANKRRDGALVDFYENVARGVSKTIAKGSPAGVDLAKALNTRRSRRWVRGTLSSLPRIPFFG
jgi:hypothetical protein